MGNTLFLLFNHGLTDRQVADAHRSLAVERIVEPPARIKDLWRRIPPDLPRIEAYLHPVCRWLAEAAEPGDRVLIQGDFGACWLMVDYAFKQELVPVYSTTERRAEEHRHPDGQVTLTHRFRHRRFRKYEVCP